MLLMLLELELELELLLELLLLELLLLLLLLLLLDVFIMWQCLFCLVAEAYACKTPRHEGLSITLRCERKIRPTKTSPAWLFRTTGKPL